MELNSEFLREIGDLLPADEARQLIEAITTADASVAVRLNASKWLNLPEGALRVPWCGRGFYLDERRQFTFDALLHAGAYYVQDASSMILQHIVAKLVDRPVRYLDLCAAPGGKTTAAIDALPEGSLMVSNEIMGGRAQILKENVMKWGNTSCVVTNSDSAAVRRLAGFFDVIAADVPCSGEGMFRKDAEAVTQWTPQLVAQCATRQREIVDNAWEALRPGGYLIYSTCTYNRSENEAMVEYLISEYGASSVDLHLPDEWNICSGIGTDAHCYRFMPHRTRGEGLFVAVVRKPGDAEAAAVKPARAKAAKGAPKALVVPAEVKTWLRGGFSFSCDAQGNVIAVAAEHVDEVEMLRKDLRVIYAGVEVAAVKGKDFIPSQGLLLSTAFNREAFACYEVDYATIMAYLRGETVAIDAPRGIVVLTYGGVAIGFVKNLGNRANNLYPREWRIKSTHIPAAPPSIVG